MDRLCGMLFLSTLISLSLSGCATRETPPDTSLAADALAYCDVYQPKYWDSVDPALGLYEQEAMAQQRLREVLRTDAFLEMMARLDEEVTHYRDLYAETRKSIQALTGEDWHCPDFANFYDIDHRRKQMLERMGSRDSAN